MSDTPQGIILNADDYALSQGVSEGILSLAEEGRLSSTSAMVTGRRWPRDAGHLRPLRDRLAIGLHLNLTEGTPLGRMPVLAASGEFPGQPDLLKAAILRRLDHHEIEQEVTRQLVRFRDEFGHAPDFIDGHHHVHAYPVVRDGVVAALRRHFPDGGPLVRDPGDSIGAIVARRVSATKALVVAVMAQRLRALVVAAGFPMNAGFSGFSTFGKMPYASEFPRFLVRRGARHMIMCHPGLPDTDIPGDVIVGRRKEEYAFLRAMPDLPAVLWKPIRAPDAEGFPW